MRGPLLKTIRVFAIQGHAIPESAHYPRGPFPSEVLAKPKMADQEVEDYNSYRVFRCRVCGELVPWNDLETHECEED